VLLAGVEPIGGGGAERIDDVRVELRARVRAGLAGTQGASAGGHGVSASLLQGLQADQPA
jgi:hypothetical protein